MPAKPGHMAPLIAIIGTDGSGKSTVSDHVAGWITRYGPAGRAHLGKQSGNIARAMAAWPLIGPVLERAITRKVDTVNDRMKVDKQPTLLPALVIIGFTMRRKLRFKRMLAMREQGLIVITDRFPQVAIPGAYDGPGFPNASQGSWLVRQLARYEHSVFEWMASHKPDLVLRLNVDLDVACARKPDHRREALAKKIAVTPLLSYGGAPIVDIDTNLPLDNVFGQVEKAIANTMAERGFVPNVTP